MKTARKRTQKLIALAIIAAATVAAGGFAEQGQAGNLSSASVTLSNSRPSVRALVAAGNLDGSSQLTIKTSGSPSVNTNGLVSNDKIAIGVAASHSLTNYDVTSIIDTDTIALDTGLSAGDHLEDRDVIATQSAELTSTFTPVSLITNGYFRVLVPAAASDSDDDIPDQDYWDFGSTAPTVVCSGGGIGSYDASTAQAGQSVAGGNYHVFTCPYTGTNSTAGVTITIDDLINPAPATAYTAGEADTYRMIVQHLNSSDDVIDATTVSVGLIEAVRVTATVSPQITFSLAGVNSGQTRCGLSTTVTTTGTTVPFGELVISAPSVGAHLLSVSTNAVSGYSVTVRENDQLGRNAKTCIGGGTGDNECIIDTLGDGAMTHTDGDEWDPATSNNTQYGFGYTLEGLAGSGTPAFEYDSTTEGACTGTSCFRQFADAEQPEAAVQILSNTTSTNSDTMSVCYKVNIDTSTIAGDYENHLLYTATATF